MDLLRSALVLRRRSAHLVDPDGVEVEEVAVDLDRRLIDRLQDVRLDAAADALPLPPPSKTPVHGVQVDRLLGFRQLVEAVDERGHTVGVGRIRSVRQWDLLRLAVLRAPWREDRGGTSRGSRQRPILDVFLELDVRSLLFELRAARPVAVTGDGLFDRFSKPSLLTVAVAIPGRPPDPMHRPAEIRQNRIAQPVAVAGRWS